MIYYCKNVVFIFSNAICIFLLIIMNKEYLQIKKNTFSIFFLYECYRHCNLFIYLNLQSDFSEQTYATSL